MSWLKKAKTPLLWLIILLLPTQLGYHFWPNFSFLAGFRIDYLSPTIYLTDILIFIYILKKYLFGRTQGLTLKGRFNLGFSPKGSDLIGVLIFTLFILLNTLLSINPTLTFFSWTRIIFYILFFLSLRQEKNLLQKIKTPLTLSTIFVIGLEITQLIKQESLNGIFYWLGERQFNLSTPNIAKINFPSFQLLRPYSTFSHPNSLAGFLLLAKGLALTGEKRVFGVNQKRPGLIGVLITLAILLTFSKSAILTLSSIIIYQKLKPQLKPIFFKTILIASLTISLLPLFANYFSLPFNPSSSILSRLYLGPPALEIIKQNPLLGTGLNNFIPALANQLSPSHIFVNTLQPIHSIPLLAISELGLIGVVLLIFLIKKISAKYQSSNLKLLVIILALTSSVDHYWWTLHQNQLILILVLALILQELKRSDPEGWI